MEPNYQALYIPIAVKLGYMPTTKKDPETGTTICTMNYRVMS